MRIDSSTPSATLSGLTDSAAKPSAGEGFGDALKDATKQVSQMENKANEMAQKVASGDIQDLHNAMIEMNKASTALELTVQVRNKVIEAYQEIMRMQV